MNTVLDDNNKLCLAREIIKMSSEMTMMFEVEDLQLPSSTVSRGHYIYGTKGWGRCAGAELVG